VQIFVVGGTGVVGRRAVLLLLAGGHQVTVSGRNPDKLESLEHSADLASLSSRIDESMPIRPSRYNRTVQRE